MTTTELTKALRVEKSTEEVEVRITERVKEREKGVKPREVGSKNQHNKENLKLSLRGSVEQAT